MSGYFAPIRRWLLAQDPTGGKAVADALEGWIQPGSVGLSDLEAIASGHLLGRFSTGSGAAELIAIAAPLQLSVGGALELADSGVAPGDYGDASHVAAFTVDAKGRLTAASSIAIGGPSVAVTTSEAVSAGQIGSFHNSSGAKVRKANATDDSKQAQCFFLAAVASGATASCYLPGAVISGLSSLTPGATYFLSTTGGGITTTAPSTAGQWLQEVGYAASATELVFAPKTGTLL